MLLAVKDTDRHTDNNQVNFKKFQGKQKKILHSYRHSCLKTIMYNNTKLNVSIV